jgi:hypothetical protein
MWPFGKKKKKPPTVEAESPYQPIPSKAMTEYSSAQRNYANIPSIAQLQAVYQSPYQNAPASLANVVPAQPVYPPPARGPVGPARGPARPAAPAGQQAVVNELNQVLKARNPRR